jgi:hypothetical protein
MSISEIILMNVGIAAVLAAILTLVMLLPARLRAHHRATGTQRRHKADHHRSVVLDGRAAGGTGRGLRPLRDEN